MDFATDRPAIFFAPRKRATDFVYPQLRSNDRHQPRTPVRGCPPVTCQLRRNDRRYPPRQICQTQSAEIRGQAEVRGGHPLWARNIDCGRMRTKLPTCLRRGSEALSGRDRALKMHSGIRPWISLFSAPKTFFSPPKKIEKEGKGTRLADSERSSESARLLAGSDSLKS